MVNSTNTLSFSESIKLFPKTVYKYRKPDDSYHKSILSEKQIWFAAPSTFTDPLDCKIPIRYDLLKEKQLYDLYYILSKESHPGYSRQQHRKDAREWVKKSPLKDPLHLEQIKQEGFDDMNAQLGILCLTEDCNNNYYVG